MFCSREITRRSNNGGANNRSSGRSNEDRTCPTSKQSVAAALKRHQRSDFMNQAILDKIESEQFRKNPANFGVGDTVRVHTKVVEGDKERIQIFTGVVIGKRGRGLNEMFTVRRISYGEGVERVFPVHSPRVDKVEVERKGAVRRAKLTYLRKRIGRGAVAVKEKEAATAAPAPAK